MNAQKNKKTRENLYFKSTHTADACQSISRSGFLKRLQKKRKSQNRENRKKKNDYKDQHMYSHGPCVHRTALRTKAFRPALSFVQHKPRSTLTAEGYLFRLQDGVKAWQLTILYHY